MVLNGYEVKVSSSYPKVQLSQKLMTILGEYEADFAKEINSWLTSRFGYAYMVSNGSVIIDETNRAIYVNDDTFKQLQSQFNQSVNSGERSNIFSHTKEF